MINKKIISVFALIFVISIVTAVFPGIPHQFYGGVMINGVNPSTGTITTKINGELVGTTPVTAGKYGWEPIFFIEDKNYSFNGKTIIFYFNGEKAGEYVFENGESTRLDLIIGNYTGFCGDSILGENEECDNGNSNGIKCDNSNHDCTYCSSSCRLITLKEKEENDNGGNGRIKELSFSCDPDWDCTNWGECVDGVKNRRCEDLNGCGISYDKPRETIGCDETLASKILLGEGLSKTSGYWWIWLLVALIILALLIILVNRKM